MLLLEPANPKVVTFWRRFAFAETGVSGLVGTVDSIHKIIPAAVLDQFPQHRAFIFAAFAIALMSALLLTVVPKVITLSFAQIGGLTSLLYIAYSLGGVFAPISLLPVFYGIMLLAILVVAIILGQGLWYFYQQHAYSDLAIGIVMTAAGLFFCVYPLYLLAVHVLTA